MNDIFLLNVDPTTGNPLGKPVQMEYFPTGLNRNPTWAPEGNRLAFLREDSIGDKLFLVTAQSDGKNIKEHPVPRGYEAGYLKWMPDGKGIGMISNNVKG